MKVKVTLFLDGSPGHEKQSLALCHALEQFVSVESHHIHLPEKSSVGRIAESLAALLPGAGCPYDLEGSDLLIGTGSRTHAALVSCKKRHRLPVVTCMLPDRYLRRQFDLCFVPRHDGIGSSKNLFLTDGPPVLPVPDFPRDENRGLILIGGRNDSRYYWRCQELLKYIQEIAASQPAKYWAVSSSPRTPDATVKIIEQLVDNTANLRFFNFRDTPAGWVEEQYARCHEVWVTADSVSMVYEALTAGCRVGLLPLQWKQQDTKHLRSAQYLLKRGWIISYQDWQQGNAKWQRDLQFNEAKRCAQEIVHRWFPKNYT